MTTINGYCLEGELGAQNAGFSRWAFCEKGGHQYYIKEFLSPVYPMMAEGLSQELVERKRRLCDDFFARKRAFYDVLARCRTGNNVIVHDFFREGPRFYAVTERVHTEPMTVQDVASLAADRKETLIRALVYSIAALHGQGIVHADLKPDNLLFKRTSSGFFTVKVIDFDAGFLVGDEPSDLQGDFVYLAPEAYLRMNDKPVRLTEKLDVFALALIVHQLWTGQLPSMDAKFKYAFQAVLSGATVGVSRKLPATLRDALVRALACDPAQRPSARELLACFGAPAAPETVPIETPACAETVHEVSDLLNHRHGFFEPGDLS